MQASALNTEPNTPVKIFGTIGGPDKHKTECSAWHTKINHWNNRMMTHHADSKGENN